VRCSIERIGWRFPPSELGKGIFDEICGVCWGEWLTMRQQLINRPTD
jgi:Fe-S cluster biosynthesis and repair protein YggX